MKSLHNKNKILGVLDSVGQTTHALAISTGWTVKNLYKCRKQLLAVGIILTGAVTPALDVAVSAMENRYEVKLLQGNNKSKKNKKPKPKESKSDKKDKSDKKEDKKEKDSKSDKKDEKKEKKIDWEDKEVQTDIGRAYTSLEEDIKFATAINAVRRQLSKELGYKEYEKISISTERMQATFDLITANKNSMSWSFGGNFHYFQQIPDRERYKFTQENPFFLLGNNIWQAKTAHDAARMYIGESGNVIATYPYGHCQSLMIADELGSVWFESNWQTNLFDNKTADELNGQFYVAGTTPQDIYSVQMCHAVYRNEAKVMQMINNATDEDVPEVDGTGGGKVSSGSEGEESKGGKTTSQFEYSEDLIPNMPKDRDYKEVDSTLEKLFSDEYKKKVKEDFAEGTDAARSIANWKLERQSTIDRQAVSVLRSAFAMVGFGILGLAAFMYILYFIDRWNVFGFSIIAIATRGFIRVTDGTDTVSDLKVKSHTGKKRRVILTDWNVFGFVALLSFISVAILSGWAYELFGWISTTIMNILNMVFK